MTASWLADWRWQRVARVQSGVQLCATGPIWPSKLPRSTWAHFPLLHRFERVQLKLAARRCRTHLPTRSLTAQARPPLPECASTMAATRRSPSLNCRRHSRPLPLPLAAHLTVSALRVRSTRSVAGTYVAVPVSLTPVIQRVHTAAAPCVARSDTHGVAQLDRFVLAGVGADTGAEVARCCFNSLMEGSYHYCPTAACQQTQLQQLEERQQMQQPSLFRTLSITPTQSSPLRESTEHSLVQRPSSSSPTVLNLFCYPIGCHSSCV